MATPHCFDPSEQELSIRLRNLQSLMAEHDLDYYLCHDPANIFYLCNFANFVHERPFIFLVPASGKPTFIMPKLEENHVRLRATIDLESVHYFEFPAPVGESWYDRLRGCIEQAGRVGVESQCPLSVYREVSNKAVELDLVDQLRMIKSDYEIDRLQYCCDLLSEGHEMLLSLMSAGQIPAHVHKEVSGYLMQKLLLNNPDSNLLNSRFNAISQPGVLSDDPHNFSKIFAQFEKGGPNVNIVQGLANGYGAELERTFFIGHVPEKAKKPFEDMLEARCLAYELLKPGMCMSELDRRVNDLLKAKGYGEYLLHRTGHSFGVTDHEAPFLAEGYEHEIQKNMIFSVEPGIYIPGLGGFRFSDTVLVTETGYRVMTSAPESLRALTLDE